VLKPFRLITALGAVLFVIGGLAACGGGVPSGSLVAIDGSQNITKPAYSHWLSVASAAGGASGEKAVVPDPPNYTNCIAHLKATTAKPAQGQKAPTEAELKKQCEQQYKSLQQEVLGFLISSSWVLGEAKSLGVKVSDNEVRNQFLHIKHQQFPKPAEFEKFLATSGQTVSDLLLRVKLNMLSQKIQQKIAKSKPAVTNAEIQKYYNENKSRYGTPEKRNVEMILTKTSANAEAAKKEIESGKSFSEVAKKYSIDPTSKSKGGQLGEVVKGQQEANFDKAIFAAKANQLGGPVKSPFGYYVYNVLGVKPGNQRPLSAVEQTIKQTLVTQQQQKNLSTFIKDFKKKWQGKTDCINGYVVANCKQYKAPKTPTGTSTAPTPTPTPTQTTPAP
jgi:foldase protein PrsA